jgi:hypothetical protein
MCARQPDYMRARHAILKRFSLFLHQDDLFSGKCSGRFTHSGIWVVLDPGPLIVWGTAKMASAGTRMSVYFFTPLMIEPIGELRRFPTFPI